MAFCCAGRSSRSGWAVLHRLFCPHPHGGLPHMQVSGNTRTLVLVDHHDHQVYCVGLLAPHPLSRCPLIQQAALRSPCVQPAPSATFLSRRAGPCLYSRCFPVMQTMQSRHSFLAACLLPETACLSVQSWLTASSAPLFECVSVCECVCVSA